MAAVSRYSRPRRLPGGCTEVTVQAARAAYRASRACRIGETGSASGGGFKGSDRYSARRSQVLRSLIRHHGAQSHLCLQSLCLDSPRSLPSPTCFTPLSTPRRPPLFVPHSRCARRSCGRSPRQWYRTDIAGPRLYPRRPERAARECGTARSAFVGKFPEVERVIRGCCRVQLAGQPLGRDALIDLCSVKRTPDPIGRAHTTFAGRHAFGSAYGLCPGSVERDRGEKASDFV